MHVICSCDRLRLMAENLLSHSRGARFTGIEKYCDIGIGIVMLPAAVSGVDETLGAETDYGERWSLGL